MKNLLFVIVMVVITLWVSNQISEFIPKTPGTDFIILGRIQEQVNSFQK